MFKIKKIISGGQTGVDRGALEAAIELGMNVGGWCPPDREAEDGRIPDDLPIKETPNECSNIALGVPRSLRTEWNVRDSDATLVFVPDRDCKMDSGTEWTIRFCIQLNKPFLICEIKEVNTLWNITDWLVTVKPEILNVAGPGENLAPGIQEASKVLITKLLKIY
ncbi:MAG: putative molybdenum carrier protein [Bacteroidia bacterium]|nr:putative molybdenum carrier protein [Bacteroidia bacterium]